MREVEFVQIDVFTDRPFAGNQLAVFLDGRGVSTQEMQTIAREMNFSELALCQSFGIRVNIG